MKMVGRAAIVATIGRVTAPAALNPTNSTDWPASSPPQRAQMNKNARGGVFSRREPPRLGT